MNHQKIVRTCLVLLGSAALATAAVQTAAAASKTTTPGQVYIVKTTLTNTAIIIPKDKFDIGLKYPRYPRGAEIQYKVTNKGTRSYTFKVWDGKTGTIRPGHTDTVLVDWNYRGVYQYETLYRGKPAGPHGMVTIF